MERVRSFLTVGRIVGTLLVLLAGTAIGVFAATAVLPTFAAQRTGAAHADQTPADRAAYCTLYQQTLQSQLHVSADQLTAAQKAAQNAVIDQAVKDGKLTQDQANTIKANIASGTTPQECGALPFGGPGKGGPHGPDAAGLQSAIQTAVTTKLGVTAAQLKTELQAQTNHDLVAVAQAHGVSKADLDSTILAAAKAQLDKDVTAGTLTAAQHDAIYKQISDGIAAGHYPLGGHRGDGPPPTGTAPTTSSPTQA